jgi:hypothetical protein
VIGDTLVRDCGGCGKEFSQESRRGHPRVYCDACQFAPERRTLPPRKATPRSKSTRQQTSAPIVRPLAPGLKLDPPLRPDGRCAVCPKQRKLTAQARKYAGVQLDVDPFCSTECARRYHGVKDASVADPDLAEPSASELSGAAA